VDREGCCTSGGIVHVDSGRYGFVVFENRCIREKKVPLNITDKTFASEVLEAKIPVLVDFWGPGCGPCAQLVPMMATLAEKTVGIAKICKLNVSENLKTAAEYGVRGVPTVIIFIGGQEQCRFMGIQHPLKYIEALGLEAD
jgi:thioredoxin 1